MSELKKIVAASYTIYDDQKQWIDDEATRVSRSSSSLLRLIIDQYRQSQLAEHPAPEPGVITINGVPYKEAA